MKRNRWEYCKVCGCPRCDEWTGEIVRIDWINPTVPTCAEVYVTKSKRRGTIPICIKCIRGIKRIPFSEFLREEANARRCIPI